MDKLGPYNLNQIYQGDCLDLMPDIPDRSIDMILADLPYGTTACEWDSIIPLEPLWTQYKRIIKPRGAIVLTASQPFTSVLVMSNLGWFKYDWVWKKTVAANFMNAKNKPLQRHEQVLVFSFGATANGSNKSMTYNPQGIRKVDQKWKRPQKYNSDHRFARPSHSLERIIEYTGYPESVIDFPNGNNNAIHPTQKPVALFSYLIRTYSNPGDSILDNVAGSGTTAISAIDTGRNWLCFEQDQGYFEAASERIKERLLQPMMFKAEELEQRPEQLDLF